MINEIIDEQGSIVIDNKEIANIFNTFFVNVESDISDIINKNKYKKGDRKELNKNCFINNSIFFNQLKELN